MLRPLLQVQAIALHSEDIILPSGETMLSTASWSK